MTDRERLHEWLVEHQTRVILARYAVKTAEEHLDEAIALSKMIGRLLHADMERPATDEMLGTMEEALPPREGQG